MFLILVMWEAVILELTEAECICILNTEWTVSSAHSQVYHIEEPILKHILLQVGSSDQWTVTADPRVDGAGHSLGWLRDCQGE